MQKIWLIIKREYLTRVRKRMFIIATLLFPILYLALVFGMGYVAEKNRQQLNIAVIDSSGYFNKAALDRQNSIDKSTTLTYIIPDSANKIIEDHKKAGYDGFIIIPAIHWQSAKTDSLYMKTNKSYGTEAGAGVAGKLNRIWDEVKNEGLGIDAEKTAILTKSRISVTPVNLKDEKSDAQAAQGIAFVAGILIYMILLIYGSQVMMGVMEEKTNRIAEIIVSSVKPFQMMLGKIIGIGLVALTQFLLWIAFVLIIYNLGKSSGGAATAIVGSMQKLFTSVDVPLILFCFAFYFLGGFFFYASLYGAIGSAANEDMREAQSLSFPITMLVILSLSIMTTTFANPNGPVAVWASIIPFSSPIVMMARIPYGVPGTVPWWQLGLSMLLLIAGFIMTVWFAGKIYRTGILMYGKKPSWKEMLKWAFRKN